MSVSGSRFSLVPYDDQASPTVGVANAKSIVTDPQILAVIGHLNSGVAIPASEVYKNASLAMVSPINTHPALTDRRYRNIFRVCGRDDVQGVVEAEFVASLGVKSVYVIHDQTTADQGLAEVFRRHAERKGIKVLAFEGTAERPNFDPIITPLKARAPDRVYFAGADDQAGPFSSRRASVAFGRSSCARRDGSARTGQDRWQGRREDVDPVGLE